MSALTRPRGPLPRRVYWARRLVVLGLALGLVFGIARLLGQGGGAEPPGGVSPVGASQRADPSTAKVSPTLSPSVATSVPTRPPRSDGPGRKDQRQKPAAPEGPCDDSDVLVTPKVKDAHAGGEVTVLLELTTVEAEACTWEVSADSVVLSITNEDGPVWSTQDCPQAVPTTAVVPRREKADEVEVAWSGRESDESCSRFAPWVLQGLYTATAIARGSVTPVDAGFVLGDPVAPTRTQTPTPTPSPSPTTGQDEDGTDR